MCIIVVLVNFALMLIYGITFTLYVSNQSNLIHRDSGFYGHNSKLILGGK